MAAPNRLVNVKLSAWGMGADGSEVEGKKIACSYFLLGSCCRAAELSPTGLILMEMSLRG